MLVPKKQKQTQKSECSKKKEQYDNRAPVAKLMRGDVSAVTSELFPPFSLRRGPISAPREATPVELHIQNERNKAQAQEYESEEQTEKHRTDRIALE